MSLALLTLFSDRLMFPSVQLIINSIAPDVAYMCASTRHLATKQNGIPPLSFVSLFSVMPPRHDMQRNPFRSPSSPPSFFRPLSLPLRRRASSRTRTRRARRPRQDPSGDTIAPSDSPRVCLQGSLHTSWKFGA
jgi:hypothetical protein